MRQIGSSRSLAEPFDLGGRETTVRASIGIASQAVDGADADELLRRADIAMYAAKSRGGDGHATYEARLYEATVARMEIKADLQGALERGELGVAYQPIVDIGTGAVTGTEALMRWQHPDRGLIPPSDFIPLAEENGLILELGRWILEKACHQTKGWQVEAGRPELTVSVNLSGRQIADGDLVGDVARALAASGLDPSCLTLKITESVLVRDIEATVAAFRELKSLGIRLAIDDFGTDYSSLSICASSPSTSSRSISRSWPVSTRAPTRAPRPLDPQSEHDAPPRNGRRGDRDGRAAVGARVIGREPWSGLPIRSTDELGRSRQPARRRWEGRRRDRALRRGSPADHSAITQARRRSACEPPPTHHAT